MEGSFNKFEKELLPEIQTYIAYIESLSLNNEVQQLLKSLVTESAQGILKIVLDEANEFTVDTGDVGSAIELADIISETLMQAYDLMTPFEKEAGKQPEITFKKKDLH